MARNASLALVAAALLLAGAWWAFGPTPTERLETLLAQRRWEDAEALASSAVDDADIADQDELYRGLGVAHGKQGEHEEAIAAYRAAHALRPDDDDLRHRVAIEIVGIGREHEGRDEFDKALARYREAVATAPEIPHGHRALIHLLKRRGETDATIDALRAALAAGSPELVHRLDLAWLLASHPDPSRRDAEAAMSLSEEALIHDRTPETLDTYAVSLAALGRYDEAVRYAVDAIRLAGGRDAPGFESRRERLALFLEESPYIEGATAPDAEATTGE